MTAGSLFLPLADGPPGRSRTGLDRRGMLRAVYDGALAPGDEVLSLRQIYWSDRANAGDQLVYCRVSVGEFQDRTEMIPYRERGAFYGPFDRDTMAMPEGDFDLFEVIERGKARELAPDMVTAGAFLRASDSGTLDQWLAEAGDSFDPHGSYDGTSLLDLVASNPCGLSYHYSRPALEKLIELGAPLTTNMGPRWGMSLLQWLTRDARDPELLAAALRQEPDVAACSTLLHEFMRARRYEWYPHNRDFLMRLLDYLPVDALDEKGMTPLQVLLTGDRELEPGMMESFELLVGAGASVDKVDPDGNTLLHGLLKNQLLRRNHRPMIDRLIELGCPVAARNLNGHAVWHMKPPPAYGDPGEERFHDWLKERLAPFVAEASNGPVGARSNRDTYVLAIPQGRMGNLGPGIRYDYVLGMLHDGELDADDQVAVVRQIDPAAAASRRDGNVVYCDTSEVEEEARMGYNVRYRERGDFFGDPEGIVPEDCPSLDFFEVVAEGRLGDCAPDLAIAAGFVRACDRGTVDAWLADAGAAFDPNGLVDGRSLSELVATGTLCSRPALKKLIEMGVSVTEPMGHDLPSIEGFIVGQGWPSLGAWLEDERLDTLDLQRAAREARPRLSEPAKQREAEIGEPKRASRWWWGPAVQLDGRFNGDDYPIVSLRNEEEGAVVVAYVIGTDGTVVSCEVQESSGFPALDNRTREVIQKRFRFKPARNWLGREVTERRTQTIRWEISD